MVLAERYKWPYTLVMQQPSDYLLYLDAYAVALNTPRKGKEARKQKRKQKLAALNARMEQISRGH